MLVPNVVAVIGTYNGARFLWDQWQSLIAQTFKDWQLLIRDDGSTDNTTTLLQQIAHDPRVSIIKDQHGRLGPVRNYSLLLQEAYDLGADAAFLVDQDD